MSEQVNPYAAPDLTTQPQALGSSQEVFMQDDLLIVPKTYTFPPICLHTGSTENLSKPIKRAVTWYHPAWALLILTGVIIFLIVVLCIQKKGLLVFQLSLAAKKVRWRKILISWGVFFSCFVLSYLGNVLDQPVWIVLAFLSILTSLILWVSWCKILTVTKIDDQFVYLRFKDQELLKKNFAACTLAKHPAS